MVRFGREEYGRERDILLAPCRLQNLDGQHAFLWTTTALDRPDLWVVEILAPVGLRATFGLRDGDELTAELLAAGTLFELKTLLRGIAARTQKALIDGLNKALP